MFLGSFCDRAIEISATSHPHPNGFKSSLFSGQPYFHEQHQMGYQPGSNPSNIPDVALTCFNGGLYRGNCSIVSVCLFLSVFFYYNNKLAIEKCTKLFKI